MQAFMTKYDIQKWVEDIAIPKLLNTSSSIKGNDFSILEGLETYRNIFTNSLIIPIEDEIKVIKTIIKDIEKVLFFSEEGRKIFRECFYKARCNQLKDKLLRLSDQEKKDLWEHVTYRYGEEVMELADKIDSSILPLEKFRLSYVLVIEAEIILSKKAQKEKDPSWLPFFYFLSQQDLLSIKYNSIIPQQERELLVEWFTEKPIKSGRKKTKEGITIDHINLMKVSFSEVFEIYKAIQKIGFKGKVGSRQWQNAALERFNKNPGEFCYIKREYLEKDKLYKNLRAKQRARFFFGKIFQYIFDNQGLPKLNKELIIEELRKSKNYNDIKGY